MKIEQFENEMNILLEPEKFKDYAINGIQVSSVRDINKIAFGVTASLEFINSAIEWGADLLFVHHGIFWGPTPLKGYIKRRLNPLFAHDIGLMAYHLPLDSHPDYGNSVQMAKYLNANNIMSFANKYGGPLGIICELDKSIDVISDELSSKTAPIQKIFPYGKPTAGKTAIVSGDGVSFLATAHSQGCNTFISGEFDGPSQYFCREEKVNFIAIGHENSEIFGVKALSDVVKEKYNIETKMFTFEFNA